MSKMLIEFDMDNAAFEDNAFDEVEQILNKVILRFGCGKTDGPIRDSNGNKIGQWEVRP